MKNNKKYIASGLVVILLVVVGIIFSRSKNNEVLNLVKNIQSNVQIIDNQKDYQKKVLNNSEFTHPITDGGAQLIGLSKDGKINKISESLGLSYGVKLLEYYFWHSKLVFVHEKEQYFFYDESTGTFDYSKMDGGFDGYYYFDNENIISTHTEGEKRYQDNIDQRLVIMAKENSDLLSR